VSASFFCIFFLFQTLFWSPLFLQLSPFFSPATRSLRPCVPLKNLLGTRPLSFKRFFCPPSGDSPRSYIHPLNVRRAPVCFESSFLRACSQDRSLEGNAGGVSLLCLYLPPSGAFHDGPLSASPIRESRRIFGDFVTSGPIPTPSLRETIWKFFISPPWRALPLPLLSLPFQHRFNGRKDNP